MENLTTSFMLVLAEVGALLLIVFIFFAWRSMKRRARLRKHVQHFMQTYNENKNDNSSDVVSRLETGCNMSHEEAEATVTEITAKERRIYKQILNLALGNENNNTFEIQDNMEGLSNSWVNAMKRVAAHEGISAAGDNKMDLANLRKQVEFLKGENSRLSENYLHIRARLETAVELLGNLVKEYSMLYAGGEESNQIVEAIEEELNDIKRAMQEADNKVSSPAEAKES